MNDKHFSSVLLLAIFVTVIAVIAQKFFPDKRLTVWPNTNYINYFYTSSTDKENPPAYWVDQSRGLWRCAYPVDDNSEYFACSFNILFAEKLNRGIDLSGYSYMNIKLNYSGSAKKVRIFFRNFNPAYSTVEDTNSTKFHSMMLYTSDLGREVSINLDEFIVGDWWLGQYDIPRHLSRPEMDNVSSFGIDYVEGKQPGNHDIEIEKIEFVGGWISAENWYLLILGCWMLGIFIFAITRLIQLLRQTQYDVQIINQLNNTNEQLQQEKDKFRRLSTVDPLTQAYNRFGIDQIVSMICSKEKQQNQDAPVFALIIIDIDHFKRINDRRGHDTGDRVLQMISTIIAKGIRPQDFLGRWGGEEFIVILPDTRKEFAIALAEKLRFMIADTEFEPDNPLAVTASFGVSDKREEEDFATTFKRADIALYAAKAQGRNCSVIAEDELTN
ncbi:GGDEF domain-containing protein [Cellvibrio mixtus]|uniref:GGDEF domain-containing protein n=1 Tax=Cellvibrio mixtus TaxID=39650 RepID=UPI0005868476|nr:GGDEF domain-containing protein [Cellvibrio mixtus]